MELTPYSALLSLLDLTIGTAESAVLPLDLNDALDQIVSVGPLPREANTPAFFNSRAAIVKKLATIEVSLRGPRQHRHHVGSLASLKACGDALTDEIIERPHRIVGLIDIAVGHRQVAVPQIATVCGRPWCLARQWSSPLGRCVPSACRALPTAGIL